MALNSALDHVEAILSHQKNGLSRDQDHCEENSIRRWSMEKGVRG